MLFRSAFAGRGEEADFSGSAAMLFAVMKNCLERDGKKWEEVCAAHYHKKTKRADKSNETDETKAYDKDKEKDIDTDIEKEPPKGRRSAKSGNSAAGGKSRSAEKKIINDGHSYDLDKLMEYAMTHTPAFPSDRRGG